MVEAVEGEGEGEEHGRGRAELAATGEQRSRLGPVEGAGQVVVRVEGCLRGCG